MKITKNLVFTKEGGETHTVPYEYIKDVYEQILLMHYLIECYFIVDGGMPEYEICELLFSMFSDITGLIPDYIYYDAKLTASRPNNPDEYLEDKTTEYPWIGYNKVDDLTVCFTSEGTGVVVESGTNSPRCKGYYSKSWVESCFKSASV